MSFFPSDWGQYGYSEAGQEQYGWKILDPTTYILGPTENFKACAFFKMNKSIKIMTSTYKEVLENGILRILRKIPSSKLLIIFSSNKFDIYFLFNKKLQIFESC